MTSLGFLRALFHFEECFPERVKIITNGKAKESVLLKQTNTELVNIKKTLDAVFTVFAVSKTETAENAYKTLKNIYKSKIEEKVRQKNASAINEAANKQKAIWKIIKRETEIKTRKSVTNVVITPDQFNKYFCSVGVKL